MRNILSVAHREILAQFAWSNVLLAFDYDGTLAPIVAEPDRAAMRLSTRRLLMQLTRSYPCIVISGRSQKDVSQHLRGVDLCSIVGNHGMEPWQGRQSFKSAVARWRPILEQRVASFRGVRIEDKVLSMAIHYRLSREKKQARTAILAAAASLGDVRIVRGKLVINVLPQSAPHKGNALEHARVTFGCDTAIYVGDDETDEDVFAMEQPGRLVTVRVGTKRTSLASFCIPRQAHIDRLLRALLELRRDLTWREAKVAR